MYSIDTLCPQKENDNSSQIDSQKVENNELSKINAKLNEVADMIKKSENDETESKTESED